MDLELWNLVETIIVAILGFLAGKAKKPKKD